MGAGRHRSTDHTDIYLAGVQVGASVPVTVISNATNLGFPAAINQGLKAARGEYLVLLNNDVGVTDGLLGSDESSRQFDPAREDCTRDTKMARTPNLQSTLPSCNLRGKGRELRATFVARNANAA